MLSEYVKSADWKSEKHVPVIETEGQVEPGKPCAVTVSVGRAIPHPNTAAHHIAWIALHYVPEGATTSVELARCEFAAHPPADTPAAATAPEVRLSVTLPAHGKLYATAYCNLHGLWASEAAV